MIVKSGGEGGWKELDFEPLAESWNTYYLQDGSKVRGRVIVLKVLGPVNVEKYLAEGVQLQVKSQNVFVVSAPNHLRGAPSTPPSPAEISQSIQSGEPVAVVESREEWNLYRIVETGEVFKVKLSVSDVLRIPRFDEEGQPVYIFYTALTMVPAVKNVAPHRPCEPPP